MLTLVKGRGRGAAHSPDALQAAIAAAEQEAREARAEAERLVAASAAELEDDKAEAMLTQSRAEDRRARRAEAQIPELREKLAEALWTAKEQAFQRYKKELTSAAKKAITAFEAAAEANIALAAIKQAASAELGAHASLVPTVIYTGLCLPDLIGTWRRHTERAIEAMERQVLPRPAVPRPGLPANDGRAQQLPKLGIDGPVRLAGGVLVPNAAQPPAAKPVDANKPAAPVSVPAPKREPRHDGPPASGQRQIHFLSGGSFSLPDGTVGRAGDYCNLPPEDAQVFVERGVANLVDAPAPPAAARSDPDQNTGPAIVEGVAKMTLPELTGVGR